MILKSDVVRQLLAEKDMSMRALELQEGVAYNSLASILRRGSCSIVTAGRIARGLGVPVGEITREEGGGNE